MDPVEMSFDVVVESDRVLRIPDDVMENLSPGRWRVTLRAAEESMRDHGSFLQGYAPEDEGLYDDY